VCTFINRNFAPVMEPEDFQSGSESNCIPLCSVAYDSKGPEAEAVPIMSLTHRSEGEARLWCLPSADSCSLLAYNSVGCVISR